MDHKYFQQKLKHTYVKADICRHLSALSDVRALEHTVHKCVVTKDISAVITFPSTFKKTNKQKTPHIYLRTHAEV